MNFKKYSLYILVSVLLVLVYPLDLNFPTGNQCIYFFWGIKNTGFGFLQNDFLATQPDPFPLFSILVTYTSKILGNNGFLFWYWLINLIYVISFFEIGKEVTNRMGTPIFFFEDGAIRKLYLERIALWLYFHSTLMWGFFFSHFFNFDLRWAWDSGFAEQGVLRGYFQPSCFGVFILLSFMFFIKRKFLIAFISAAIAACFHANYLVISGAFILVYILFLLKEKNYKPALLGSIVSLVIVFPYLIYLVKNFGSSSPETIEYIKNHIQGHIHFDYKVWMNGKAFLQLALIIFSMVLVRKTPLFLPLFLLLIIFVALTLLTYLSGSVFLLSLTLWRVSIVLVPVALAIILTQISSVKNPWFHNLILAAVITASLSALYFRIFGNNSVDYLLKWRIITAVIFVVFVLILFFSKNYFTQLNFNFMAVILIVCLGLSGILLHKNDRSSENELISFVKQNLTKKQRYIVPPGMRSFRLETGAPVFADSNIYHSNSLPEWEKRIKIVNRVYSENSMQLLDSLAVNCGITHIIAGNEKDYQMNKKIFERNGYVIFELNKTSLER